MMSAKNFLIRNKCLFTFFILAAVLECNAQFTDSTTKFISYASTGVINKTNDGSSYVLNNNLRFNVKRKDVSLNAAAGWIYGEQNSQLTNNDFNSSLDFNLFKTFEHFYYWGLATYEKSRSLKIHDRAQIGLGGAYNVVEREKVFLNLSEGVLFEKSDVDINDSTRERNSILRNSFRLRYRFSITDKVVLEGTHFVQNALSDINDYIFKSNNSLNIRLTQWLNLTTALTYNKVNKTDRENLLVTYGLTVQKYF
jgi:hypothetical protein